MMMANEHVFIAITGRSLLAAVIARHSVMGNPREKGVILFFRLPTRIPSGPAVAHPAIEHRLCALATTRLTATHDVHSSSPQQPIQGFGSALGPTPVRRASDAPFFFSRYWACIADLCACCASAAVWNFPAVISAAHVSMLEAIASIKSVLGSTLATSISSSTFH